MVRASNAPPKKCEVCGKKFYSFKTDKVLCRQCTANKTNKEQYQKAKQRKLGSGA